MSGAEIGKLVQQINRLKAAAETADSQKLLASYEQELEELLSKNEVLNNLKTLALVADQDERIIFQTLHDALREQYKRGKLDDYTVNNLRDTVQEKISDFIIYPDLRNDPKLKTRLLALENLANAKIVHLTLPSRYLAALTYGKITSDIYGFWYKSFGLRDNEFKSVINSIAEALIENKLAAKGADVYDMFHEKIKLLFTSTGYNYLAKIFAADNIFSRRFIALCLDNPADALFEIAHYNKFRFAYLMKNKQEPKIAAFILYEYDKIIKRIELYNKEYDIEYEKQLAAYAVKHNVSLTDAAIKDFSLTLKTVSTTPATLATPVNQRSKRS